MGRTTLAHLVIIQAIGLGIIAAVSSGISPADAIERADREPAGVMRLDARDASKVELRGDLKCPMPESNTGRSCTLQITDRQTGQTLRVVGSNTAMRLLQNGQTQVVATGTVMGDALRIIEIRPE